MTSIFPLRRAISAFNSLMSSLFMFIVYTLLGWLSINMNLNTQTIHHLRGLLTHLGGFFRQGWQFIHTQTLSFSSLFTGKNLCGQILRNFFAFARNNLGFKLFVIDFSVGTNSTADWTGYPPVLQRRAGKGGKGVECLLNAITQIANLTL